MYRAVCTSWLVISIELCGYLSMQGPPISNVFSHHHEPSRNKYSSSKFWNSCHWNIYTIILSLNLLKFISNNIAILEALIAGTKQYIIIQLLYPGYKFSLSIKIEFIISLIRSDQSVEFHFYLLWNIFQSYQIFFLWNCPCVGVYSDDDTGTDCWYCV